MPRFQIITEVTAPISLVFDLSRNIDVHQRSQAMHGERAIAGRTSGLIEQGEEVSWEAIHFGVRQQLTSRIVNMEQPTYFRDTMVKGAFKRFDHDHYFESLPDGRTRMRDVFDYTSPFGPVGRLADALFLERYMRLLIGERNAEIKRLAEASKRGF